MTTLITVKPGTHRKLPPAATNFTAGLGWAAAGGVGTSPDLDLWILRHKADGSTEVISWANQAWHRPDLGQNSQGNPYIATPELDVIHQGDDRTGAESADGFDELVKFDVAKAPADVTGYSVWATIYDEKNEGLTLGMASDVTFGVIDDASGNGVKTDPAATNSFDLCMNLCTIDRAADGTWSVTAIDEATRGTAEDMFAVAKGKGAKL